MGRPLCLLNMLLFMLLMDSEIVAAFSFKNEIAKVHEQLFCLLFHADRKRIDEKHGNVEKVSLPKRTLISIYVMSMYH